MNDTTPNSVDHEHHRMIDGEMHHFHHRETNGHRSDQHTKWVVGVISSALITLLAFFALENYRMVNRRIDDQKSALHGVVRTLEQHQSAIVEMQTNQRTMLDTQKRIEAKLDLLIQKSR